MINEGTIKDPLGPAVIEIYELFKYDYVLISA